MAGDWIKMREDLHEDLAVLRIAEKLKTRPEHIVGYLHKFWAWVSRNTADGILQGASVDAIESVLGLPHFLSMLVDVGWLEVIESPKGIELIVPNFDRHLSNSAKKRALDARSKQSRRVLQVSEKCPPAERTKSGPEKRREEKSIKKKVPKKKDPRKDPRKEVSEDFQTFWESFSKERRTKKADAWRAWQQMGCHEISEAVIEAAKAYARSSEGKGEFCSGPAPWLRAGRWDDFVGSREGPPTADQKKHATEMRRAQIVRTGRNKGISEDRIESALKSEGIE